MKKKKKIPKREQWLHDNPEALKSLKKGLKESAEGKAKPFDMSRLADEEEL